MLKNKILLAELSHLKEKYKKASDESFDKIINLDNKLSDSQKDAEKGKYFAYKQILEDINKLKKIYYS